MRWLLAALMVVTLGFSTPAAANIILSIGRQTSLARGFQSAIVSAIGTNGERITGFWDVTIKNAHQVFALGDVQSPRMGDFQGMVWEPSWEAYDTHLLPEASQVNSQVVSQGQGLLETNDGSTTGKLGLAPLFGLTPRSGFGDIKSIGGHVSILKEQFVSSNLPILHLVWHHSDPIDVSVTVGDRNGRTARFMHFTNSAHDGVTATSSSLFNDAPNGTVGVTISPEPNHYDPDEWGDLAFNSFVKHPDVPDGAGGVNLEPEWDPATRQFNWNTTGSPRGTYKWYVSHSIIPDLTVGIITVVQNAVPEPTSATLVALAALVVAGNLRRRLAL